MGPQSFIGALRMRALILAAAAIVPSVALATDLWPTFDTGWQYALTEPARPGRSATASSTRSLDRGPGGPSGSSAGSATRAPAASSGGSSGLAKAHAGRPRGSVGGGPYPTVAVATSSSRRACGTPKPSTCTARWWAWTSAPGVAWAHYRPGTDRLPCPRAHPGRGHARFGFRRRGRPLRLGGDRYRLGGISSA